MSNHAPIVPVLLKIDDAAAYLSIGRRSVQRLIEERALTPVRIGRSVRLRRSDLDTFINNAATDYGGTPSERKPRDDLDQPR